MSIDVHTHIFPSGWPDFAARYGGDRWPRLEGDPATGCRLFLGATLNRSLTRTPSPTSSRVWDQGWKAIADAPAAFAQPPSAYARRVWVDSLTLSPKVLTVLDPLGLDTATRRRLTVDNAREFLALP